MTKKRVVCVADCSDQFPAIRACVSEGASKQFLNNYEYGEHVYVWLYVT